MFLLRFTPFYTDIHILRYISTVCSKLRQTGELYEPIKHSYERFQLFRECRLGWIFYYNNILHSNDTLKNWRENQRTVYG